MQRVIMHESAKLMKLNKRFENVNVFGKAAMCAYMTSPIRQGKKEHNRKRRHNRRQSVKLVQAKSVGYPREYDSDDPEIEQSEKNQNQSSEEILMENGNVNEKDNGNVNEKDNDDDVNEYKIPHRFIGFNTKRIDLEEFPKFRLTIDGKMGQLLWTGTECAKCGMQIRREKRSNRESSLNIYAHASISREMLRSCPENRRFPIIWRSRDPYEALEILGVEDC